MKLCDEHKSFGFLIHDISRLLKKVFDRRVKSLGLTRSQWSVIAQLCRKDGLSQNELAEFLEIEQPSVVKLLDKLEESHLVERRPDPHDRRSNQVFLTEKSKTILAPMQEIVLDVRKDMLTGISPEEQEVFLRLLTRVKANLLGLDKVSL